MKYYLLCLGVIALVLLGAHSARVSTDGILLPFNYAAAAGYLNVDDGREHPFDGTVTVNKFGRNADSDTSEDSIWDGSDLGGPIRCFDVIGTTAAALYISSDHEDDATLEVTVEYLDANWDTQTLDVALGAVANGTATEFVQIGSGTIMRVNRAYATSTALTGNVYIHIDSVDAAAKDGIPDTVLTDYVAGIVAGENQTLQACYTVPNDFSALLTQYCTTNINTAANAVATFRLRRSAEGAASRVAEIIEMSESVYQCTPHDPPVMFAEKTDIELTAVMSQNNASATGTFDLVLIPE